MESMTGRESLSRRIDAIIASSPVADVLGLGGSIMASPSAQGDWAMTPAQVLALRAVHAESLIAADAIPEGRPARLSALADTLVLAARAIPGGMSIDPDAVMLGRLADMIRP